MKKASLTIALRWRNSNEVELGKGGFAIPSEYIRSRAKNVTPEGE
jgi:hypothetical protein